MNYSKRQHIVPKFYLKGFAAGKKIQVLDFHTGRVFPAMVNNAAVHKDFYTVKSEELEPDIFENWLSSVEAKAATIIRKVEEGDWPLKVQDRETLAFFMVLQQQRGKGSRDMLERMKSTAMGLLTLVKGFESFSEELEDFFPEGLTKEQKQKEFDRITAYEQGDETTFKVDAHQHINTISYSVNKLVKYLTGRPWRIVEFERRSLITSDEPLGFVRPPNLDENLGVGLMNAEILTFPLTRKIGLYMLSPRELIEKEIAVEKVRNGAFDARIRGTTVHERTFNELACQSAFRSVFFHPEDSKYLPAGMLPENP